jgi:tetratricopeptide (TPR) repeat protein
VLADAALKEGEIETQLQYARQLLREYPDAPHRPKYLVDVAKAFFMRGRYQECADHMRDVVERYKDDPQYVGYNETLFYALNGIGDLEGMEQLVRKMQEEYPERIQTETNTYYRGLYEQWYDVSDFWIGYVRFAAYGKLLTCKEYLEQKTEELKQQGKALPKVQEIFLEFRVKDILLFLETYQGKPPASDFSSGIRWATEKKLTIPEAKGKVLGVLFRNPRDLSARTFLEHLSGLGRALDGVSVMTLGYFPNKIREGAAQQRVQGMLKEHEELGLDMPGGFDASPHQRVFRSIHANVGTPSFIAFDRDGKFAWYLMNPKDMDCKMMERVLRRLARSE